MKIDRYKDLEHKFFQGEELSPQEEQSLKAESDNPYFSFIKEEKQEKLDISFDDFLSKVDVKEEENTTPIIALPTAKPRLGSGLKTYWMAASLVMFMGVLGGYLFVNEETGEITKPTKAIVTQDTEIENQTLATLDPATTTVTTPAIEPEVGQTKGQIEKTTMAKTAHHTKSQPKTSPAIYDQKIKTQNQDYAYNPNYVVINGKPVYNEQEAISLTEDAVNYLASNVSETVDHAKSVKKLNLDF